jgi:tryptophan 2,3-dioxygenase
MSERPAAEDAAIRNATGAHTGLAHRMNYGGYLCLDNLLDPHAHAPAIHGEPTRQMESPGIHDQAIRMLARGGTAGVEYLQRALDSRFFPESWELRTQL